MYEPVDGQPDIAHALAHLQAGQPQAAIDLLSAVLAQDPQGARAAAVLAARALAHSAHNQQALALADLDQALALAPELTYLYTQRGDVQHALGAREQALADYTTAITQAPTESQPYFHRAMMLWQDDPDQAIADLTTVIGLQPGHTPAYVERAKLLFNAREFLPAVRDLTQAVALNPHVSDLHEMRTQVLENGLLVYTQAIVETPNDPNLYWDRATLLYEAGRTTAALADIDQAVARAPHNPLLWANRGALRLQVDDLTGALDDLSRAISLDPAVAETYKNRALILLARQELPAALADLDAAVRLAPHEPGYRYLRGVLYRHLANPQAAIQDQTEVLGLGHEDPLVYDERGLAWAEMGALSEALGDFKRALAMEPSAERLYRCGVTLAQLGVRDEALNFLDQAVATDPAYTAAVSAREALRAQG